MRIFICHKGDDNEKHFSQLKRELERNDIPVWTAESMDLGGYVAEELRAAIDNCEACVFVATEASVASGWCLAELGAFWGADKEVFIYKPDPDVEEADLPRQFRERLWTDDPFRLLDQIRAAAKERPVGLTPDLDISCYGELLDLLHVRADGSCEPTPGVNSLPFRIRNGRLQAVGDEALFNCDAEATKPDGRICHFEVSARGEFDGDKAFLVYRFGPREAEVEAPWFGVMVLRIPKSGDISGFWMTTGFLDATHTAVGTARLARGEPQDS